MPHVDRFQWNRVVWIFLAISWPLLPVSAHAGEVPEGSLNGSLGVPADLLDDAVLAFRYPQLAATFESQIIGSSRSVRYERSYLIGVGAIARRGGHALFFAAQPDPDADLATHSTRTGATLLQVAWGMQSRGLRFGIALRGARGDESRVQVTDNEPYDAIFHVGQELRIFEGAIGLGIGSGRSRIDAVLEERTIEVDGEIVQGSTWERRSRVRNEVDPLWTAAARLALAVGERQDLLLAGSWGGRSEIWTLDKFDEPLSWRYKDEPYRDAWAASAAWTANLDRIDRIYVYSTYRSERFPYLDELPFGRGRYLRLREGRGGIAVREKLGRGFEGLAGVSASASSSREIRTSGYGESGSYRTETTNEALINERFSWGLAYGWRNLNLIGALSTTLDIEGLLLSLDARWRF